MSKELLKNKPKYPETTSGTHCMGENWTVCCPNKHLQYDRYIPTKQVVNVYYKGGIYRVFVCTSKCLSEVKNLAKNNPELFKKTFINIYIACKLIKVFITKNKTIKNNKNTLFFKLCGFINIIVYCI